MRSRLIAKLARQAQAEVHTAPLPLSAYSSYLSSCEADAIHATQRKTVASADVARNWYSYSSHALKPAPLPAVLCLLASTSPWCYEHQAMTCISRAASSQSCTSGPEGTGPPSPDSPPIDSKQRDSKDSSGKSSAFIPGLTLGSEAIARMTPAAVVERLDRHIIGQADAKKAVAVAFRNRWRRHRVSSELKSDITPKNILMIGPTGCGKTEIARRLAKLADAPFIKVEATKFTEVGYHGRDVDSIIKDLVDASIAMVRTKLKEQSQAALTALVERKLLSALVDQGVGGVEGGAAAWAQWAQLSYSPTALPPALNELRARLRAGEFNNVPIAVELPLKPMDLNNLPGGGQPMVISLDRLMGGMGSKKERRQMPLHEARGALEEGELERLFPPELVTKQAIHLAEQDGIVVIDEIDKVAVSQSARYRSGDPSSDGVQRDLLPIIEGSTVQTKHGNVNTDHILFICSGAFHSVKPSDLMAELQGRLPIRVMLKALTQEDFYRILTEPQYNLIKQQQMLLATEGVDLHFTDAAIREIARLAEELNQTTDNIGARRLAAVLERCVERVSFSAPELVAQARSEGRERFSCVVDKENVEERVAVLLQRQDLSKWIL
ncbi:P-loop containing nucleoside triphosphate hydrolase protein [Haematococcus lacustris]